MKTRGLTTPFALAGFLAASCLVAFSDEATTTKLVPLTTSLSSTVISGYVSVGAEYNLPTLASRTSAFEPVTDERESGHDAPISAQFSGGDFPTGGLTDTFPVVEPSGPNGVFTISQPIEEYPTTTIPEPSSVGLCAFGLGGLIIARRSIRQRSS